MRKPAFFVAALLLSPAVAGDPVWQETLEIASGPGEKGPWQKNDSRYRYVDDPAVSIGPDGAIIVAWVDQARKDVFVRRMASDRGPPPDGEEPVNVSRSAATFSWLPRIVHAPDERGTIYLLWQEIIFSGGSHGGDILFARSMDGGRSFTAALNLSDSVGGDGKGRINAKTWHNGSQDIAAAPGGIVYAAWTEYEGSLWFSRSLDGGKSFSRPRRITGGEGDRPARAPSLAVGAERRVYLAWTHGEDKGADIHLAVSDDGGEHFGKPVTIDPSEHYSDAPRLGVGPDGVLHLAYARSDGGPFDSFHIRYTRSRDGGRSFETPRIVSPGGARFPYLDVGARGLLAIAFELHPDQRKAPRGLGMTASIDGGDSFSSPAEIPGSAGPPGGTNGSHQGWLMDKLALDAEGNLAVVNSSLVPDRLSRAWLMRGKLKARP